MLERGNEQEILEAKKAYRKKYFTLHKRKQRKNNKEYTIRFSKEKGEQIRMEYEAKQYKMKITEYLKSAVMAYINKAYVVPDRIQVAELEQLLSQCLNEIQAISKQKERYSFDREYKYELIEKRIEKLESEIINVLKCPYTIEEIVLKGIEEKPDLKEQLLTILTQNRDDYQNKIS